MSFAAGTLVMFRAGQSPRASGNATGTWNLTRQNSQNLTVVRSVSGVTRTFSCIRPIVG